MCSWAEYKNLHRAAFDAEQRLGKTKWMLAPKLPADTPIDPLDFARIHWPHIYFYEAQREAIYSVVFNDETYVVAGHRLGKDFLAGFIVLWYFRTYPEVRIITTSVKDDHLRVLWGEIGRYIDNSSMPLTVKQGGDLVVTHHEIRKMRTVTHPTAPGHKPDVKVRDKISYVRGMVSERGEGMAGHHARKTLLVVDEASGVDHLVLERASSWAKKILVIGNPYGPSSSWFGKICKAGDVAIKDGKLG